MLALAGHGLPAEEDLGDGVRLTRLVLDRRITSALRPLPASARTALARLIELDPEAVILPATSPRGLDRLRHPWRRALELAAHARRVRPWTTAVLRAAPDTDVFQTQALPALPVVRDAARSVGARFVYDFADFQTEAARIADLPRFLRAAVRRRERRWTRDAAGLLAVSEPMADAVAQRFGVARPAVVPNTPPAWRPAEPEPPVSTRLRDALGLAPTRPIILYHGQFKPGRGIEELLRAADMAPLRDMNAAIVLMGYGRLQPVLDAAARQQSGRVYVLPPVPVDALLGWVAGADLAYVGFPPLTLNMRLTIPNKLFEALMAGVPVVGAKGTEQARLIESDGVGRAVDIGSAGALAGAVAELLTAPAPERQALRQRCRTLALTKYSWELTSAPLLRVYRQE